MPLYEHVFLARQDVSSQQVEALTDQFKSIIEQNGGKIAKVEQWGLKSLTFRVRKNRKAHFTLMNIDAPPAAVAEMERQQRINEDVIRVLTIRVDELEEGCLGVDRVSQHVEVARRWQIFAGAVASSDAIGFEQIERGAGMAAHVVPELVVAVQTFPRLSAEG